jgi:glycine cleavage system regulatory protein
VATLVLTVIGDDQSGLVNALATAVTDHGGNWDRSQMARLGGKFAGIVMITVGDASASALQTALEALEHGGLLAVTVEAAGPDVGSGPSLELLLDVVGLDRPGIINDVSHALATRQVSIEELQTETASAPMAGGTLFRASARLRAPAATSIDELRSVLDDLAHELLIEIDLTEDPGF